MIELLVIIGIIAVLGVVATLSLTGTRNTGVLKDTTQQIGALLREAQSDSMAQSKGAQWGVHFDNMTSTAEFYSLFYTFNASYGSSTENGHYPLPSGLCYATSSVPLGSSSSIIFGGISGAPSASTTITLQLMSGGGCAMAIASSTITISTAGAVGY